MDASSGGPEAIGRYLVTGVLGAGGFGTVFGAHDPDLDVDVAVKVLSDHLSASPALVEQFLAEARTLRQLDHPRVVPVHDLGTTPAGQPWFVMDLMEGGSLADRLESVERSGGRIGPEDVRAVGAGLAEALDVVHGAGLVHADVKPANLFVRRRPAGATFGAGPAPGRAGDGLLAGGEEIVLGDFGLAGAADAAGAGGGTPGYLAPEQVDPTATVDASADLFAATAVIRRILTGDARPGRGSRPVDPAVQDWLDRTQHPDPAQRPADARAWLAGLDDAVTAALAHPPPGRRRARRAAIGLVAGGVGVAAAVTAAMLLGDGSSSGQLAAVDRWLMNPQAGVVDADGSLLVADTGTGRVLRFPPGAGPPEVVADGLEEPTALLLDADGGLVVAARAGPRDPPPGLRLVVAADGPAAAGIVEPCGLAVDGDGTLVVGDRGANRIWRLAPDGELATLAGTGQRGFLGDGGPAVAAAFSGPCGLAVLADGSVVVADTGNHRVRLIGPDGTVRTVAGTGVASADALASPTGVAVATDGVVWVADSGNGRVVALSPEAGLAEAMTDAIDVGVEPVHVSPDGTGLVVTDRMGNAVLRVEVAGPAAPARPVVWVGGAPAGLDGDGWPATAARLTDVRAVGADGDDVVLLDGSRARVVGADGVVRALVDLPDAVPLASPVDQLVVRADGEVVVVGTAGARPVADDLGAVLVDGLRLVDPRDPTAAPVAVLPGAVGALAVGDDAIVAAVGAQLLRVGADATVSPEARLADPVAAVGLDDAGTLWVGVGAELVRLGPGPVSVVATVPGPIVWLRPVGTGVDATLLVATATGVHRFDPARGVLEHLAGRG